MQGPGYICEARPSEERLVLFLPNAPVLRRELSRAFVFRAMRSARALASAWTFAIVLRIRARAAALRLVLAIFSGPLRFYSMPLAEQERT
jgi:hypothetical protein